MAVRDTVGPEYYNPLKIAEIILEVLFYITAALSIIVLLVSKKNQIISYEFLQVAFILCAIGLLAGSIILRTYFAPRAHKGRVADFVTNAFTVPLIASPSQGYHNTAVEEPFLRMGAFVLENALFTKSILRKMLQFERVRIAIYTFVWLAAVLNRSTDLELLAIAAQVLFSEQVVSRWVRMEWLRSRVERVYDDLYALIQSTTNYKTKEFKARIVEALIRYETGKAQAGLSISTRVFNKLNHDLSKRWESISNQLGLPPTTDAES